MNYGAQDAQEKRRVFQLMGSWIPNNNPIPSTMSMSTMMRRLQHPDLQQFNQMQQMGDCIPERHVMQPSNGTANWRQLPGNGNGNGRINQIAGGYTRRAFMDNTTEAEAEACTSSSNAMANYVAHRANTNIQFHHQRYTSFTDLLLGNTPPQLSDGNSWNTTTIPHITQANLPGNNTPRLCDGNSWNTTTIPHITQANFPGNNTTLLCDGNSWNTTTSTTISHTTQGNLPGNTPRISDGNSWNTTTIPHITQGGMQRQYQHQPDYFPKVPPGRGEAVQVSKVTNLNQFTYPTPQNFNTLCPNTKVQKNSMGVTSNPEKYKGKEIIVLVDDEDDDDQQGCSILENVADSSTAVDKIDNNGLEEFIDLNKTPQQKIPKRRKHRPKVCIEGKSKKTARAATTKKSDGKEKRRYVPKSKPATEGAKDNVTQPTAKSCRRALNFEKAGDESQNSTDGPKETEPTNKENLYSNAHFQAGELPSVTTSCIMPSMRQTATNFVFRAKETLLHQPPTESIQARNARVDVRNEDSTKRMHAEQLQTFLFQAGTANLARHESYRKQMLNSTAHSAPNNFSSSNEPKGYKRQHFHTMNPNGSSMLCQKIFQVEETSRERSMFGADYLATNKKQKSGNEIQSTPYSSIPQCSVEANERPKTNGTNANLYALLLQRKHRIGENHGNNLCSSDVQSIASRNNLQSQQITSKQPSFTKNVEVNNNLAHDNKFSRMNTVEDHQLQPPTPPRKTLNTNVSDRQMDLVSAVTSNSVSSGLTRMQREKKDDAQDHHQPPARRRGRPPKKGYTLTVDDIMHRLNGLSLSERSSEQNALVPYKANGTIVPYEGFGFLKKRKTRPRVDLDPESNRLWNLLMGKEGLKSLEGTDEEKEKWWEEERKIVRGRVDSFIARMHLVQGDRRFTRWKGSVVDSVIGVFLTQNVSDHLSSSAFMSLAARFPLKSESNQNYNGYGTTISVEEPEVSCLQNPDDTTLWDENSPSHQLYQRFSFLNQSAEQSRENVIPLKDKLTSSEIPCLSLEEEAVSSQDSFDSSIIQGTPGIRSCSGSNSEAEDLTAGSECNKICGSTFTNLLQMDSSTLFEDFYSVVNGSPLSHEEPMHRQKNQKWEKKDNKPAVFSNPKLQVPLIPSNNDVLHMTSSSRVVGTRATELYGEENTPSWHSASSAFIKATDDNPTRNMVRQLAGSVTATTTQVAKSIRAVDQSSLLPYHDSNWNDMSVPFQQESTSVTQPVNRDNDGLSKNQFSSMERITNILELPGKTLDVEERISRSTKQIQMENKLVEPNAKEQVDSIVNGRPKVKKGKVEHEKTDWDSLRKQVQSNGNKRERSKDATDSLDYEALRCADVKEISNAIRERGMNNMLADRIKAFLNRIVEEHESIDLEWLRDVPPDKAKDYLLSIWGLGLKSVECVRLLTLHHLAFPVDTNVGRIAVRLGWVPLQPLPESLQLHLLELYPVLESIQKHLWPRLCKLDQRTLYELHYQMITFGKVFCTKSKPNCNACPMRAECRHFASAFASARLALPGPEDKSNAKAVVLIKPQKNPGIVINPLPLPPAENNMLRTVRSDILGCEPIIEEPASPEPEHCELTERDIEDSFWDDPDEIPTIKLNIDEFTANLHTYMQEKMELGEGDMSKALVALNPVATSFLTPKLKNINRLRTEHHVYELPDSHPLLKEMDTREPDDPSPYLLAIWTPGETANSAQPSDEQCKSQGLGGKLCDEKTCFSCNSIRETNAQTVRGTILIPCRTAMRGSFPLNGTYFQVNEMFADHESSIKPIDVPRSWIWNLPRRIVFFGTSVSTIFKGLSTEGIQYCFWKGFVCVRGFDPATRAPRPLMARLHFPASKLEKKKDEKK